MDLDYDVACVCTRTYTSPKGPRLSIVFLVKTSYFS